MSGFVGLGEFEVNGLAEFVVVGLGEFEVNGLAECVVVGERGVSGSDASGSMIAICDSSAIARVGAVAGAIDADASDAMCAVFDCPLGTWRCAA